MKKNTHMRPLGRVLVTLLLLLSGVQVQASENDSACVMEKNSRLFNQCDFAVDVGFCVVNPKQTKNFFDSSEAFTCPNGGLSTISPGKKEGNILHGTVHWFACNVKHRGTGRWGYVEGSGYKGRCFKEDARATGGQTPSPRSTAVASAAECKTLENRLRTPGPLSNELEKAEALTAIEYLDRNCGNLTQRQRADARQLNQRRYLDAVAKCKQSGGGNCDGADVADTGLVTERPPTPAPDDAKVDINTCPPEYRRFRQFTVESKFVCGDAANCDQHVNRMVEITNSASKEHLETLILQISKNETVYRKRSEFGMAASQVLFVCMLQSRQKKLLQK
ncbi:MAG: hypothetical protein V4857_17885 [Pseudomonadota bacterium]